MTMSLSGSQSHQEQSQWRWRRRVGETGEAIDPWPHIDFNWRLEAQLCADKAKKRHRLVKCDWGLRPRDVVRKKLPKKCPHIAWLSHANQRHRRFKEIYQTSCFSKTIVMNMTPPSYPQIDMRTDISNNILCRLRNLAELCLLIERQSLENNMRHSWVPLVIIISHYPSWMLRF